MPFFDPKHFGSILYRPRCLLHQERRQPTLDAPVHETRSVHACYSNMLSTFECCLVAPLFATIRSRFWHSHTLRHAHTVQSRSQIWPITTEHTASSTMRAYSWDNIQTLINKLCYCIWRWCHPVQRSTFAGLRRFSTSENMHRDDQI